MSALGQKQTCAAHKPMSALPPKADIVGIIRTGLFCSVILSWRASLCGMEDHRSTLPLSCLSPRSVYDQ